MSDPTVGSGQSAGQDARDRRARVLAVSSVAVLVAAGIVLYSWIQTRTGGTEPIPLESLAAAAASDSAAPKQGDRARDFSVATRGGGTFVLDDHLAADGRPVFLNLWASWCPPCRNEMPVIDAASQRHPNVAFVGVAIRDDFAAAKALAEEIGVGYTIGFDTDDVVADGYPVLGMPATFLISAEGLILERWFGEFTGEAIDALLGTYFGG